MKGCNLKKDRTLEKCKWDKNKKNARRMTRNMRKYGQGMMNGKEW